MTKRKRAYRENVVGFGAHNDDLLIGAGGTLAKYAKEGSRVISVIFSYGEMGLPQYKKKISISIRAKECRKANKILGISEVIYLGLEEGTFKDSNNRPKIEEAIRRILKRYKPKKVFTHSYDDAHPDHRAVSSVTTEILEKLRYKGEIFTYQVWNVLSFRNRNSPQLIVDITDTFKQKTEAFKAHKSQQMVLITLMWKVYLQAILNGVRNKVKFAEVFYKER